MLHFTPARPWHRTMFIEHASHPRIRKEDIPVDYWTKLLPYAHAWFEEDDVWTLITQFRQFEKLSFWTHWVKAHQELCLHPTTKYPTLCWHSMSWTNLDVQKEKNFFISLDGDQNNLFYLQSNEFDVPMQAGKTMLSFHINLLWTAFCKLATRHPILRRIANLKLQDDTVFINARPLATNPTSNWLMSKFYQCVYNKGLQADCFLERAGIDLLLTFAWQNENIDQAPLIYTVIQQQAFKKLFEFLISHPSIQLPLPELANWFGLSINMLEIGFRQHFGLPIETFMTIVKMMHIYDQVVTTNLPLSVIAQKNGFISEWHLQEVFKNHYDCSISIIRSTIF